MKDRQKSSKIPILMARATESAGTSQNTDWNPPIDTKALSDIWGGNRRLMRRTITRLPEWIQTEIASLRRSLGEGNVEEFQRLVHGIKGAASFASAGELRMIAMQLESIDSSADLTAAEPCLDQMQAAITRYMEFMGEALARIDEDAAVRRGTSEGDSVSDAG